MPVREDAHIKTVDARQHQGLDVGEDRVLRRLAREDAVELEVLAVLRRLAVRPLDDDARLAAALAADLKKDCIKDCVSNCNRVAPGNKAYCAVQCEDYCAQDDRKETSEGN